MISTWKKYKLEDIASLRKEQFVPKGEDLPYVGLEHIEQQVLRLNGIGSSKNVKSNKFRFYPGDILYGKLRPYFRKVYKPKFGGVCSTDIYVIKNKQSVNNSFLYYLIASEEFTSIANSGSTGTHMPRADWKQLEKSEWILPINLFEQESQALILSSLDDKIELNLQMNKTLETIAQAIFKEWFVDFRFPGFDGDLVRGLPKGWFRQKLNTIIDIKHGYAFKGEFFSEEENENILLTPANFKIGGGFNETKLKYYCGEIPENYILEQNDLIVTMTDLSKAGDTLGFSALVPEIAGKNLLHNQRLGKVIFKVAGHLKYYVNFIMQQPEYRHYILGGATGSTVKHTSPTRIGDYTTVIPDENTLSLFENIAAPLLERVQENLSQNRTLI